MLACHQNLLAVQLVLMVTNGAAWTVVTTTVVACSRVDGYTADPHATEACEMTL